MGRGNLLIQARVADDAVPLEGVRIAILDNTGNILYRLVTDESGQTEQITLDTVSKELSLNPNFKGTPYVSYNLIAEKEGFISLNVKGIHIFDGENAIQPITLMPATQGIAPLQTIIIGEHSVESADPRTPVGPVFEPAIFRNVIIPNPITIHLGAPSASAQNVLIPFVDYIKNVASSEIYPTWPQAALRANIYAIITFALNRVFTQWYRSQGYNFDITNSTAYDQAFVYGRTTYESINRIVDEIFNQYVRRAGQIAPFFTSFCNGTTVTCAGLSQWGTVSLANQGRTPIQILRNYYPNDIEISQTNIITGVTVSFPGTTLRLGSTGLAVQTIQNQLNRIRRNYPAIPQIVDETGVFGTTTQAAVTAFQRIFNLVADGAVGFATWNKISFLYVAIAKLASLNSEGTALGIGTVPPSSILRVGSSGIDVITLQYLLTFIGQFYPVIPEVTQDGIFGSATAQAVIAFQQMVGLNPDGIVGPSTWNALYTTYWNARDNVPIPPPEDSFEYTVRPGDTLFFLAQRFGTTVEAIKSLNNLTSDVILVGQTLRIPGRATVHIVQPGDTLWLLAQRFNTTIAAIRALNNLTSDVLLVGQTLFIK